MTAANEKPSCPCCGSDATWQEDECVRHTCTRCRCQWWESQRRAQPAEAVDEAAAALKELLDAIDARYVAETERKRANAISPRMDEAIAKARELLAGSGAVDEAVTLLREVYDHGENFELHERIRVFLGIKD